MRMRTTTKCFLAAIVLLSAFTSCKESGEPEIEFEGEKTVATLTLKIDNSVAQERAITFPASTSNIYEKQIYNAIAVAFDNRGLLEATAEFDQFANGGVSGSASIVFDEITVGMHQFFVIANAPKTLLERKAELFPRGMFISDFLNEYLELSAVQDIIREKLGYTQGDANSNTRGFLMSNESAVSVNLAENSNLISIQLVRTIAKVSLGYDPTETPQGELENVEYKVVNNPRATYLILNGTSSQFTTPYFSSGYNPNNYLSEPTHNYQPAITSTTANADKTYTYCIENSNVEELQGNSTMVMIKAKFKPNTLLDKSGSTSTANSDGTFWRLREIGTGVWGDNYYKESPDVIPEGFEAVKYDQGICYYHSWIRSSKTSHYQVKRNTYVKMTITKVYSAGVPGEGDGVDPEQPIVEGTTAVINIEVKNWEEDEQDIEL